MGSDGHEFISGHRQRHFSRLSEKERFMKNSTLSAYSTKTLSAVVSAMCEIHLRILKK